MSITTLSIAKICIAKMSIGDVDEKVDEKNEKKVDEKVGEKFDEKVDEKAALLWLY